MNAPKPPRRVDPPRVGGRVPPHNLDAEAAVLSAAMLDRTALDVALEILKPEHFYSEANARIWQAVTALAVALAPIDFVAVSAWLRDREWLERVGGVVYLAQLVDATPAVGHVGAHAKVVREKWRLREIIATCQRVAAEGYGDVGDAQAFAVEWASAAQALVNDGMTGRQTEHLAPVIKRTFEEVVANAQAGKRMLGTPTGYTKLDAKTSGLCDGNLVVVAGRSGMGKTSFVLNIAANVASPRYETIDGREVTVRGDGVAIFSLEMPREELAVKMVCSEARVDIAHVRQHTVQNWAPLNEAAAYLATLPIWIDDTPALTVLELRAKVRRLQAEYNREATETEPARRIGMVMIDYLQLMRGREGQSEYEAVTEISKSLKALAKDLNVPVVALSQLNRSVETRSTKDKRPQMSDLRSSGQIEQDADTIILLYRDEYYYPETTKMKGIAEAIIAKQRNGATGKVFLRFTAACTRFDNLESAEYPDDAEAA